MNMRIRKSSDGPYRQYLTFSAVHNSTGGGSKNFSDTMVAMVSGYNKIHLVLFGVLCNFMGRRMLTEYDVGFYIVILEL